MTSRTITLAGREIPRVGLGTNRLDDTRQNRAFLEAAFEAGLRHVDTAHLYAGGASETTIGAVDVPDDAVVATKGGFHPGGGTAGLLGELRQSLERLRTDRIDLLYVHRLDPEVPVEETMEALAAERDAGRIGHIGLSEVSVEQIERARAVAPVAAVQNEFNLDERGHDAVVDHCEGEGIVFVPFFPLRGGNEAALREIGRRHGAGPDAIRLAWLLARSPVILPIPGTLSIEHLRENLTALDVELSHDELARLSAG
jgi:pyridoxine 4-dehydrogenase